MSCLLQVASDADYEYDAMDEDDQDKFSYQLLAVSSLARLVADYSLPLLTKWAQYILSETPETAFQLPYSVLGFVGIEIKECIFYIDCLVYTFTIVRWHLPFPRRQLVDEERMNVGQRLASGHKHLPIPPLFIVYNVDDSENMLLLL